MFPGTGCKPLPPGPLLPWRQMRPTRKPDRLGSTRATQGLPPPATLVRLRHLSNVFFSSAFVPKSLAFFPGVSPRPPFHLCSPHSLPANVQCPAIFLECARLLDPKSLRVSGQTYTSPSPPVLPTYSPPLALPLSHQQSCCPIELIVCDTTLLAVRPTRSLIFSHACASLPCATPTGPAHTMVHATQ